MGVFGKIPRVSSAGIAPVPSMDTSFMDNAVRILTRTKIKNDQIQEQEDTLNLARLNNSLTEKSNELFQSIKTTGDYQDAQDRWDTIAESARLDIPAGMSKFAQAKHELIVNKTSLTIKDKLADVVNTYRTDDITNELSKGIDNKAANAIGSSPDLEDAYLDIKILVGSLPGLSEEETKFLTQKYQKQLAASAADQIVGSDPKAFLKNSESFESKLGKNEIKMLRLAARAKIQGLKSLEFTEKADRRLGLESKIDSQIQHAAMHGTLLYPELHEQLKEAKSKKIHSLESEQSAALKAYTVSQKMEGSTWQQKEMLISNSFPKEGESNFNDQWGISVALEKSFREQRTEYETDPVAFTENKVSDMIGKTGANIYQARYYTQQAMGSYDIGIKLFSNAEQKNFTSEWENNPVGRADLLSSLLKDVPENLKTKAVSELELPTPYVTSYSLSEGNDARTATMFHSLNTDAYKVLTKSQKEEVNALLSGYAGENDNYLSYYTRMAMIKGDPALFQTLSDITELFQNVAYDYKFKGFEDITGDTEKVLFGAPVSIINNDIVVGQNTALTPLTEATYAILEKEIRREEFPIIRDVSLKRSPNPWSDNYSPVTQLNFLNGSAVWVQNNKGFELWDEDSRDIILNEDGESVFLSFEEVKGKIKEYEEMEAQRLELTGRF